MPLTYDIMHFFEEFNEKVIDIKVTDDNGNSKIFYVRVGLDSSFSKEDYYSAAINKIERDINLWQQQFSRVTERFIPATKEIASSSVPSSITRRQCALEMQERGMITGQEALDMTKSGTVPFFISSVFAGMPEEDRIKAEIDFAAAAYFRDNPLLISLMKSTGANTQDIDNFFISAYSK